MRTVLRSLPALALVAAFVTAAPATSAPDPVVYDALGDSYASGAGSVRTTDPPAPGP